MLLYVAGPYSGDVAGNIARARAAAVAAWRRGWAVICPHMNSANMDDEVGITHAEWIVRDCDILRRCDAVLLLDNWYESAGARLEREMARLLGIPMYTQDTLPRVTASQEIERTTAQ